MRARQNPRQMIQALLFAMRKGLIRRPPENTFTSEVDIDFANLRLPVLAAWFLIGFALSPPVMRWISKRVKRPTWEHAVAAFSMVLFINLSNQLLVSKIFSSLIR